MGVLGAARTIRVPTSPGTERPMLRRWPFAALAGTLLVYNAQLLTTGAGFGPLALPASALLAVPVVWAWFRPLPAWAAMAAGQVTLTGLGLALDSPLPPQPWLVNQVLAQLPVMYVLALSSSRRVTAIAYVVTLAAGLAVTPSMGLEPDRAARGALSWALALLVAAVLGHARRVRRLHTLRVAEELGRLRILEERSRIARELHDVVAHHMSVIAVRAASAPYRIEGGVSEAAAKEFADLNAAARESLRDMRHLLGALRGTGEVPAVAPQPGLGDLGGLVASVRQAGVPVELAVGDPAPEPPPVVSLTAYRIVQEALSNVVRHAPGARTTVTVRYHGDGLLVEVANDAPARATPPQPGSGLGLIGMRERVAALGGRLATAPTAEGGFTVRAELPVDGNHPDGRTEPPSAADDPGARAERVARAETDERVTPPTEAGRAGSPEGEGR